MDLTAHPFPSGHHPNTPVSPTTTNFKYRVPTQDWLALLETVGFCEILLCELALPTSGPASTEKGRARFAQAIASRNDGDYAETMRRCRIVLNELGNAGFGGKAPREVVAFLKEKAGTLTQAERYSAFKLVAELYLSPAHHANAPEEDYVRADADLALFATAMLLKLAPIRGGGPTEQG